MQECFYGGLLFGGILGLIIGYFAFNEPLLGALCGIFFGVVLGTLFHIDANKYADNK